MKTLVSASLFTLLTALAVTAAAQSAPPPAPAPPPPAAPAPAAYPPPPSYPPAPGYGAPPAPNYPPPPGYAPAPLPQSPLYAPSPYGPSYYGPPPRRPYGPPLPPPPPPPEGTAAFVGRPMVALAWDIGVPVASVHDFTSNVSAAGFDIAFRYWLCPRLTLGAEVEWQTYRDERPRTTYALANGALTATAYNSLQMGSVRFGGQFYLLDRGPLLPYVGADIGYAWGTFQTAAADIALYDDEDSVVVGGELGTLIALAPRKPLILAAARYSWAPSLEFLNSVSNVQTVTFQLGLLLY